MTTIEDHEKWAKELKAAFDQLLNPKKTSTNVTDERSINIEGKNIERIAKYHKEIIRANTFNQN